MGNIYHESSRLTIVLNLEKYILIFLIEIRARKLPVIIDHGMLLPGLLPVLQCTFLLSNM